MSSFWAYLQTVDLNQVRSYAQSLLASTSGGSNAPVFNDETISKIEKWAPAAFAGFTALYCLFKHTPAFAIGLSLGIYQTKYPTHLTEMLKSFAKNSLPYQDKEFGRLSILLDSKLAIVTTAALAAMWAPNITRNCIPIYFTYVVTSAFLSPTEEQKK